MKHLLSSIALLCAFSVFAQAPDFRQMNWGMTRDAVIATEAGEPYEHTTEISYLGYMGGLPVRIIYGFNSLDQLSSSHCEFFLTDLEASDLIENHKRLEQQLTRKYGPPIDSKMLWYDELLKDEVELLPYALEKGYVGIHSTWKTATTIIALRLTGSRETGLRLVLLYDPTDLTHIK